MLLVTFTSRTDAAPRVGMLEGDDVVVIAAPTMLAWLGGDARHATGEVLPRSDVTLLAPVPEPPSVRDFYAFEGHVAAGWKRRGAPVPDQWYRVPAFYFSNPAAIYGPGQFVQRPASTRMLDFELEVAAVIGADGDIAGFTLMNDWSARDVQREEVAVLLGPAKAKDFATSLGPWIATPDDLPYRDGRLHMEAWVTVNGREVGRGNTADQHFSWPDLVAHAARDTRLRPGDILGSGTLNRGCLLELGPLDGGRWIEPGDVVALHADGLGTLETRIT